MRIRATVTACALILGGLLAARTTPAAAADQDATIASAYRAAYDLDFDAAAVQARAAIAGAPDSAKAHRALASILWLDIIFRRGAVSVDAYLGGVAKAYLSLPPPAPDLDAEFKKEVARAIELASARLNRNSGDVQARHDVGSAYALQASYLASVEGSLSSAFFSGRRAYDAEETVLEQDPQRVGAGVVVGTYRYLVSSLGLPSRLFAYMVGFGGGKDRGIQLINAATRDPEAHVEARTALALIYSREGRHVEAMTQLAELAAEFPGNRVFILEQGAAAVRAGRYLDADGLLSRGLATLEHETRRRLPGERALWLYKRGLARLGAGRRADAIADLENARSSSPVAWVRGRVELALGKAADLSGRRDEALARYRAAKTIADGAKDPLCAVEAERLLKQTFRMAPSVL